MPGKIWLLRADGMLVMGEIKGDGDIMVNPRAVDLVQEGGAIKARLLQLIGMPKQLALGNIPFSWECQDAQLIDLYLEDVTGITIAKTIANVAKGNVVDIKAH